MRLQRPTVTPPVTVHPDASQLPSPITIGFAASRFVAKLCVAGSNLGFPAGGEQYGPIRTLRPMRTSPFT